MKNFSWRETERGRWQMYLEDGTPLGLWADEFSLTTIERIFEEVTTLRSERKELRHALIQLIRATTAIGRPRLGFCRNRRTGRSDMTPLSKAIAVLKKQGHRRKSTPEEETP